MSDDRSATLAEEYERNGGALFRRALASLRCRAAAEDAVHAVFARLAQRGLDGLRDREKYLHVALRHEIAKRERRHESSDALDALVVDAPDSDPGEVERVAAALSKLPESQREVVVMHVYDDLTLARIAELLETSPNTIQSRYRYACEKLQELLRERA